MVLQQDYVYQEKSVLLRRKKTTSKGGDRIVIFFSVIFFIFLSILIGFTGYLYFITDHEKKSIKEIQNEKTTENTIPEKPTERWKYIKKLERQKIDVCSLAGFLKSKEKLDNNLISKKNQKGALFQNQKEENKRETIMKGGILKKNESRWIIQCGSFKYIEQAKFVHAKLIFDGFNSHITTENGWNRVVIGPVKDKENANNTMNHLKSAGYLRCICLSSGG